MFRRASCIGLVALLAFTLTACGGGGGAEPPPGPPPPPAPLPTWAVSSSSVGDAYSVDVAEAPDGSIAVVGGYSGACMFAENTPGAEALAGIDSSDSWVARFADDGTLLWVEVMAGLEFTDVRGLDVGPDGAVYVAGFIYNTITFAAGTPEEITYTSDDGGDGFVAAYESTGVLRWSRLVDGTGFEELHDVTALADGGVVVAGLIYDPITLGAGEVTETTLTPTGIIEAVVISYAPDGALRWARSSQGLDSIGLNLTNAFSIARLSDGSIAVAGDFTGTTTFGSGEPNETTLVASSADQSDGYVARYDASGNLQWVRQIGGVQNDYCNRVLPAPLGALRLTGWFANIATFDGGAASPLMRTAVGSHDGFVASYDAAGDLEWVNAIGGVQTDQCLDTRVLADGTTTVVGYFTGSAVAGAGQANETTLTAADPGDQEAYIACFDAAGLLQFATAFGGAGADAAIGLMPISDGTWIVTGSFTEEFVIDGVTALTGGAAASSAFIARVGPEGEFEDPAP